MYPEGLSDYYDPSFRNTLEAHLAFLRTSAQTYTIPVPAFSTVVYNQDLIGFLLESKIAPQLHWLVMRMNGFYSPYDFDARCTVLLIPQSKEVDILRQSWKTTPVLTT
jgi:hypothetical protein